MEDIWAKNEESEEILLQLTQKIMGNYITSSVVYSHMLCGKSKTQSYLNQIGAIHQMIQTSIRFSQYRRAMQFIILLDSCCKRFHSQIDNVIS